MKIAYFFLCLIVGISGCSKSDVDPDVADRFVGTWQSELRETDLYYVQDKLTVDKTGSNELRITDETKTMTKDASVFPSSSDTQVLHGLKVSRDGVFNYEGEYSTQEGSYQVKISGLIRDGKLSLATEETNKKTGEKFGNTALFTKISG